MTDREVLDALTVLARRLGLLGDEERLAAEPVPVTEETALCLAFGMYGQTRLCCTYGKDHAGACTWERAMVGKSACIATTKIGASGEWLCERPAAHNGEHKATGPDGVRWTWGDTATTGLVYAANKAREAELRCGAKNAPQNPVMAGQVCALLRGHEGSHEAVVNGQRWVFGGFYGPRSQETLKLCRSHSPRAGNGAYFTCVLLKGHEGEHRSITALGPKTWRDSEPDPTEPRA